VCCSIPHLSSVGDAPDKINQTRLSVCPSSPVKQIKWASIWARWFESSLRHAAPHSRLGCSCLKDLRLKSWNEMEYHSQSELSNPAEFVYQGTLFRRNPLKTCVKSLESSWQDSCNLSCVPLNRTAGNSVLRRKWQHRLTRSAPALLTKSFFKIIPRFQFWIALTFP